MKDVAGRGDYYGKLSRSELYYAGNNYDGGSIYTTARTPYDNLGLTDILDLRRNIDFDITFVFKVIEHRLVGFQQVIYIIGFASSILLLFQKITKVLRLHIFNMTNAQFGKVSYQIFALSSIIPQRSFCQMATFAIIDKLFQTIGQKHRKTPFPPADILRKKGCLLF